MWLCRSFMTTQSIKLTLDMFIILVLAIFLLVLQANSQNAQEVVPLKSSRLVPKFGGVCQEGRMELSLVENL